MLDRVAALEDLVPHGAAVGLRAALSAARSPGLPGAPPTLDISLDGALNPRRPLPQRGLPTRHTSPGSFGNWSA